MLANGNSFDIFEHKIACVEFTDDADKILDQRIAGVIERSLPDHRKPLARCAAENNVDFPFSNSSGCTNGFTGQVGYGMRNDDAFRKVECMDGRMDRVDFYRRDNIEAGLFKAEAEAARTGEKVYPNRSVHVLKYIRSTLDCRSGKQPLRDKHSLPGTSWHHRDACLNY